MNVQNNHKPFGASVIEAHRLLKNSVHGDNYVLISKKLANVISMPVDYTSKLYRFRESENEYDGKKIKYTYSEIDRSALTLRTHNVGQKVVFEQPPEITIEKHFPINAEQLLEFIANYKYHHLWADGVDEIIYDANEVTRKGSEHLCVINEKH